VPIIARKKQNARAYIIFLKKIMKALAFHPFFDIKYTDVLEMTKI
jgi:hypothetical protein